MIREMLKKYSWEMIVALVWVVFFAGINWFKAAAAYDIAQDAHEDAAKAEIDITKIKGDVEHIRYIVDKLYDEHSKK